MNITTNNSYSIVLNFLLTCRALLFFKFLASIYTRDRKPYGLIFVGVPKSHALFLHNICLIEIVCHRGCILQVSSTYRACDLQSGVTVKNRGRRIDCTEIFHGFT